MFKNDFSATKPINYNLEQVYQNLMS